MQKALDKVIISQISFSILLKLRQNDFLKRKTIWIFKKQLALKGLD